MTTVMAVDVLANEGAPPMLILVAITPADVVVEVLISLQIDKDVVINHLPLIASHASNVAFQIIKLIGVLLLRMTPPHKFIPLSLCKWRNSKIRHGVRTQVKETI